MKCVSVAIPDIPFEADMLFSYGVPAEYENEVLVGRYCRVPFGRGNSVRLGVILAEEPYRDGLKDILALCPSNGGIEMLGEREIFLSGYLRNRYFCSYYDAIRTVMTVRTPKKNPRKIRDRFRNPLAKVKRDPYQEPVLNTEQQKAFDDISAEFGKGCRHLIYGVTGSGKTQIYIRLAQKAVSEGRSVLFLVPEIALTFQIVRKLYSCFGDNLAVLHSELTDAERFDTLYQIYRGDKKVVVGTRSALFAPVSDLGLIILDEEQEGAYKSEMNPKYDAREVAYELAKKYSCPLVYGSATPSFEAFMQAKNGITGMSLLEKRYNKKPLPQVITVDMRNELCLINGSILSNRMMTELGENLRRGEQSVLFMNRRGYNTHVTCLKCGETLKCPHCGIPLCFHSTGYHMQCNYCGYTVPVPESCEACGGKYMRFSGTGTQKVEEELLKLFPEARIKRMDSDTISSREDRDRILQSVLDNECDILLGTQMITKGLDFPNVTLAGILNADMYLYSSDFRAFEKSFSLITQVIGRAGRSESAGRAVIQTYSPSHRVLQYAYDQDYTGFFENECAFRKAMLYPPYCQISQFVFIADTEERATEGANRFISLLSEAMKDSRLPVKAITPRPTSVPLVDGRNRVRILVKYRDCPEQISIFRELYVSFSKDRDFKDVQIGADINPSVIY